MVLQDFAFFGTKKQADQYRGSIKTKPRGDKRSGGIITAWPYGWKLPHKGFSNHPGFKPNTGGGPAEYKGI